MALPPGREGDGMRLTDARAHIGDKVIYRPPGQGPEAAEEGVVTSLNDVYVFVRYGSQVGSAATRPEDLTALSCSCTQHGEAAS